MNNLGLGLTHYHGIYGRAQHGGFGATLRKLRKHGLIDADNHLTEEGSKLLETARGG